MASKKITNTNAPRIDGKALVKKSFRSGLGFMILVLTVTVPCFMSFFS